MEWWSIGVMGRSKDGTVELWNNGIMENPEKRSQKCFLLLYQYSNTPILQYSCRIKLGYQR